MPALKKGQILGKYSVSLPYEGGEILHARIKDKEGRVYFLKAVEINSAGDDVKKTNILRSLEKLEGLSHPNLIFLEERFDFCHENKKYRGFVLEFVSGETLTQYIGRHPFELSSYFAKALVLQLLDLAQYLHNLNPSVFLGSLSPKQIMLDYTQGVPKIKVISLEFSSGISLNRKSSWPPLFFTHEDYFQNKYTLQADIFSIGAILYFVLHGNAPWFRSLPDLSESEVSNFLHHLRAKSPNFSHPLCNYDSSFKEIINSSLGIKGKQWLNGLQSFRKLLKETPDFCSLEAGETGHLFKPGNPREKEDLKRMGGFSDVAGMEKIKDQLQSDVIDVLKDQDRAKKLGLALPNGLLFYGPPGCGKTFFAKKIAEELGCYFLYVSCSDVASPYIHGGQEKIAKLFEEARKNAPSIIFFDEIEAMVKDRALQNNVSEAGEVNEFLTQLNNSGQEQVIVIGATNRPDLIDPAALRSGRLEYKYYIPLPDYQTRLKLFQISLKNRSEDIDINKLADLTDKYICADITLIVAKAARRAFREKSDKIKMEHLLGALAETPRSVSEETLANYDDFLSEPRNKTNTKIGFY